MFIMVSCILRSPAGPDSGNQWYECRMCEIENYGMAVCTSLLFRPMLINNVFQCLKHPRADVPTVQPKAKTRSLDYSARSVPVVGLVCGSDAVAITHRAGSPSAFLLGASCSIWICWHCISHFWFTLSLSLVLRTHSSVRFYRVCWWQDVNVRPKFGLWRQSGAENWIQTHTSSAINEIINLTHLADSIFSASRPDWGRTWIGHLSGMR